MVSSELRRVAEAEARGELTDRQIYLGLSKRERSGKGKRVFVEIANMEQRHYNFWRKYCNDSAISANGLKVRLVLLMRYVLGGSFIIKFLEGSEARTVRHYESLRRMIPKTDIAAFNRMVRDEGGHEQDFALRIEGTYVAYISFIVLGLADAIVEIAGIHAGSLGIYKSTELTGLAGVIAGAAASLSMASAAYAQAKQGFEGSAKIAASYTGASYFVCAVILASPYFLTRAMPVAITASLLLGVLMIAFISWYDSVISKRSRFLRSFAELAGVMIGATIILFILGAVIRSVLGISI